MIKLLFVTVLLTVVSQFMCSGSLAEKAAGEAIGKLLQEKISKKFRDAANEVKGVLVKHLGKSLKEAHSKMNPPKPKKVHHKTNFMHAHTNSRHRKSNPNLPLSKKPCDEECRLKKMAHPAKCHTCQTQTLTVQIQGASIHHNKSGRNRKDGENVIPNGVPGPGSPPGAPGADGSPPGSPMMQPPSAPGSPMIVGQPSVAPGQCGGSCPGSCAPSCDNTCCAMQQQQPCPPACIVSCFSYCPSQCCRK